MQETIDRLRDELESARKEIEALQHIIRIAAGLLSTHPQFSDKHPEEVLRFIQDASIDAARGK